MRKFPLVRQRDAMDCGISCISSICNFYGRNVSLETLAERTGISSNGISLLAVSKIANDLGFKVNNLRISITALYSAVMPCILHWNQNHFVVLYKIKKGKIFYVADPGKGLVKYNLEQFKKYWLSTLSNKEYMGIAMFLEPTSDFYKQHMEEDSLKEQRSLKILFEYIEIMIEAIEATNITTHVSCINTSNKIP